MTFPPPLHLLIGILALQSSTPSLLPSAVGYIVERQEVLNGRIYTIHEDQPFYRVYHRPHVKVFRPKAEVTESDDAWNALTTERNPSSDSNPPNSFLFNRRFERGLHLFDMFSYPSTISQSTGNGGREEPRFGHHHLPAGERKDDAEWPRHLLPYLQCMHLACQCPLFNGIVMKRGEGHSEKACLLPNGRFLEKALRKEYRQYTRAERAEFLTALNTMKSDGIYNKLSLVHRRSGVHSGPGFFPWHREFLNRLELVFRTYTKGSRLGLPYWDSTLDNNLPEPKDSVMFSDYLTGESSDANNGSVVTGPFAYWETIDGRPAFQRFLAHESDGEFFNEARIDFVLNQTEIRRVMAYSLPLHTCINYTMEDRFLEYSHDYVHYYIAGDMHERYSSSNDPLFFMHHGFVDSVWERWRQTRQTRHQREHDYPPDNGECTPPWHFSFSYMPLMQPMTNLDGMSNRYTDEMYEYVERPSCTKAKESSECQSEFLFCDSLTDSHKPICSVKVKLGGNCAGLEWSKEVCYEGRCVGGKCHLGDGITESASNHVKGREGEGKMNKSHLLAVKMAM